MQRENRDSEMPSDLAKVTDTSGSRAERRVRSSDPPPYLLGSWDYIGVWPPNWAMHPNQDRLVILSKLDASNVCIIKSFWSVVAFAFYPPL